MSTSPTTLPAPRFASAMGPWGVSPSSLDPALRKNGKHFRGLVCGKNNRIGIVLEVAEAAADEFAFVLSETGEQRDLVERLRYHVLSLSLENSATNFEIQNSSRLIAVSFLNLEGPSDLSLVAAWSSGSKSRRFNALRQGGRPGTNPASLKG